LESSPTRFANTSMACAMKSLAGTAEAPIQFIVCARSTAGMATSAPPAARPPITCRRFKLTSLRDIVSSEWRSKGRPVVRIVWRVQRSSGQAVAFGRAKAASISRRVRTPGSVSS
jgi:hypothetical protein